MKYEKKKKEKEEIKVLPILLNVSFNKDHFIITLVHFFMRHTRGK